MARMLPLALGAVAGGALVYVLASVGQSGGTSSGPAEPGPTDSTATAEALDPSSRLSGSVTGTFTERVNIIEEVERIADVDDLVARIRRLAAGTPSTLETFELEVLLARLVRLDPSLTSLIAFADVKTARVVATELLDVLGDDDASIEAMLVPRFAEAWSVSDPTAALDWALEHAVIGTKMLPRIAVNFRSVGLDEALAVTSRLPPEFRSRWIQSTVVASAGTLIDEDPDRLLRLLSGYEGLEGYDAMIRGIASSVALSVRFGNDSNAGRFAENLPDGDLKRAIEEAVEEMP